MLGGHIAQLLFVKTIDENENESRKKSSSDT